MDRQIVYPGSIPLDTDLLRVQRNTLLALGALSRAVLGEGPVADGLACVPAGTGWAVVVGPGSLTWLAATDATPYGALGADPVPLVQTGINREFVTLTFTGPPDGDHALCWLIQAALDPHDAGPVALPYWNAGNPAVPWSGPGNGGQAQNTQRVMRVKFSAKPGQPQLLGDPQPPAADPGWVGLHTVMTYFGRPLTVPVDVQPVPGGPMLPFNLPGLAPGFSRQEAFGTTTVWRVPPLVRRARVRVVGGGAGGGGGGTDYGGGGGGAGGYAEGVVAVQPGALIPIQVGAGGPGAAPRINGVVGGASWFGGQTAPGIAAGGGTGGHSGNPDSRGGEGGPGLAGLLQSAGGGGGDGAILAGIPAGLGGSSALGGGGRAALGGGPQNSARGPGGGGGGGYGDNSPGGSGAPGVVIVEY